MSVSSDGATVGNVVQEVSSALEGETNRTVLRGRSHALGLGGGIAVKPLFCLIHAAVVAGKRVSECFCLRYGTKSKVG